MKTNLETLLGRKPTVPEADAWNWAALMAEQGHELERFSPLLATPVYEKAGNTADIVVIKSTGIISEDEILLIERKHEPHQGEWALAGGFLNPGKERMIGTAIRELKEETNIDADSTYMIAVSIQDEPQRDPRGHTLSFAFLHRRDADWYDTQNIVAKDDAAKLQWFPINALPPLAFDHAEIIRKALTPRGRERSSFMYSNR